MQSSNFLQIIDEGTKSLRTLHYKQLMTWLPKLKVVNRMCTIYNVEKQHRETIPKKSQWRASQKLQLIHADIGSLTTPSSSSNEKYILSFFMTTIGRIGFTFV